MVAYEYWKLNVRLKFVACLYVGYDRYYYALCRLLPSCRSVADISDMYATWIFILRSHYNHFDNEDADCMVFWNVDKASQFCRVPRPENMIDVNRVPPWNIKTNYVHYVCHIGK